MIAPIYKVNPPPMRDTAPALLPTRDAHAALERGLRAWNREQLLDALESAKRFIAQAEVSLGRHS